MCKLVFGLSIVILLLFVVDAISGTPIANIGEYWNYITGDTITITKKYGDEISNQWSVAKDLPDSIGMDIYLQPERLWRVDLYARASMEGIRDSLESPSSFPMRDEQSRIVAWKTSPSYYIWLTKKSLKYDLLADMFIRMSIAYSRTSGDLIDTRNELNALNESLEQPKKDSSEWMYYLVPTAFIVSSLTTYLILSSR